MIVTRRTTTPNPRCRNKCRSRVLIDEAPTWAVWMCTTCEHRHVETEQQLGLFARADAIPRQPDPEDADER
jgi:hypothetical protein